MFVCFTVFFFMKIIFLNTVLLLISLGCLPEHAPLIRTQAQVVRDFDYSLLYPIHHIMGTQSLFIECCWITIYWNKNKIPSTGLGVGTPSPNTPMNPLLSFWGTWREIWWRLSKSTCSILLTLLLCVTAHLGERTRLSLPAFLNRPISLVYRHALEDSDSGLNHPGNRKLSWQLAGPSGLSSDLSFPPFTFCSVWGFLFFFSEKQYSVS